MVEHDVVGFRKHCGFALQNMSYFRYNFADNILTEGLVEEAPAQRVLC